MGDARGADKIREIQKDVEEVKEEMGKNVERVLANTERLDKLDERTGGPRVGQQDAVWERP